MTGRKGTGKSEAPPFIAAADYEPPDDAGWFYIMRADVVESADDEDDVYHESIERALDLEPGSMHEMEEYEDPYLCLQWACWRTYGRRHAASMTDAVQQFANEVATDGLGLVNPAHVEGDLRLSDWEFRTIAEESMSSAERAAARKTLGWVAQDPNHRLRRLWEYARELEQEIMLDVLERAGAGTRNVLGAVDRESRSEPVRFERVVAASGYGKRDLVAAALKELAARGWAEKLPGRAGYRITHLGTLAAEFLGRELRGN